jgi:hypothetical protein
MFMNKEISANIARYVGAVISVVALISTGLAIAKGTETAGLLSEHIESLQKDVASVRLIYLPDGALFRTRADEKTLGAAGCMFQTDDKSLIGNLISTIKEGRFTHNEKNGQFIETRYGIYFTRRDGFETKILLDKAYKNSKKVYGLIDEESVEADPSLPEKLVKWTKDSDLKQVGMCRM